MCRGREEATVRKIEGGERTYRIKLPFVSHGFMKKKKKRKKKKRKKKKKKKKLIAMDVRLFCSVVGIRREKNPLNTLRVTLFFPLQYLETTVPGGS